MSIVIVYKSHRSVSVFRTKSPRVEVASTSRVRAEWRVNVVACRRNNTSRHEVDHVLVSIVEVVGQTVFTKPHERTGRHGLRGVPDRLADVEVTIVDEPFAALRDAPPHAVVGHRDHKSVRVAHPADGAVLAVVPNRPFPGRRDDVRLVTVEVERRELDHTAAHDARVLVEFVRGTAGLASSVDGHPATESEMKNFAQSLYSVNNHFLPAAAVPTPNAMIVYKYTPPTKLQQVQPKARTHFVTRRNQCREPLHP